MIFILQDHVICVCTSFLLQKSNACEVFNLSSIKKCTSAMRMLAYGLVANTFNEY
jgi:hypothetical protein